MQIPGLMHQAKPKSCSRTTPVGNRDTSERLMTFSLKPDSASAKVESSFKLLINSERVMAFYLKLDSVSAKVRLSSKFLMWSVLDKSLRQVCYLLNQILNSFYSITFHCGRHVLITVT